METTYYCHCGGKFKQKDNIGMDLIHKTYFRCDTCNEEMTKIEDYEDEMIEAIEKQKKSKEQEVWVFNKEGFLSIASNEFEKEKLEECLKVKPKKAKFIYIEGE